MTVDTEAADLTAKLLATTDASVWTEEFLRVLRAEVAQHQGEDGKARLDPGWVLSWFANAIETGRSAGASASRVELPEDLQRYLSRIVGEACGYVSLCWDPRPTGVFDSTKAGKGVDDAVAAVQPLVDSRLTHLDVTDTQRSREVLSEYDRGVLRVIDVFLEKNERTDLRGILGPVAYEAWERLSQSL